MGRWIGGPFGARVPLDLGKGSLYPDVTGDTGAVTPPPDAYAPGAVVNSTRGARYAAPEAAPVLAAENIRWRDDPALDLFNSGAGQLLNLRDGWDDTLIGTTASMITDAVPTYAANVPQTSPAVLDGFNTGASQDLTARAGWSATGHFSGSLSLKTDAGPTYASTLNGTPAGNIWGTGVTTDHEASFKVGSVFGTTFLVARQDSAAAPSQGYVGYVSSGNQEIQNRAGTTLASGSGITPAAGDEFRFRCVGSVLTLDYKPSGGVWRNLLAVVDTQWTTGTFIGIHAPSGAVQIDSFGGGAVSATASYNFWGNRADKDESVWVKYGAVITGFHWLWARATFTTSAVTDGYFLYADVSGYGELWRVNAGVATFMQSGFRAGVTQPGDRVMIQAVGSEISAWVDNGNGWQNFITATDSSIPDGGFIGVQTPAGSATRFDSFGGGPFTSVQLPTVDRPGVGYSAPASRVVSVWDNPVVAAGGVALPASTSRRIRAYDPEFNSTFSGSADQDVPQDAVLPVTASRPQQAAVPRESSIISVFASPAAPSDPALVTISDQTYPLYRPVASRTQSYAASEDRTAPLAVQPSSRPAAVTRISRATLTAGTETNTFADWTPEPVGEQVGPPPYTPPRSRTIPAFTPNPPEAIPAAQSRAVPDYSAPLSRTGLTAGTETDTYSDWTPGVIPDRQNPAYSPPRSLTVNPSDNTPPATDTFPPSAASRATPDYAPQPSRISLTVTPGPDVTALTGITASTPARLYTPPRSQALPIFDPAANTYADWAPEPAANTFRPVAYSPGRNINVLAFSPDTTMPLPAIQTTTRPAYSPPRSQTVSPADNPAAATDTAVVFAQSARPQNYSAPRSQALGIFDPAYNTFADWAPEPVRASSTPYGAPRSRVTRVIDGPSGAPTDTVAFTIQPNRVASYSAPLSRSMLIAGAETNSYADWSPEPVASRQAARYSPPASQVISVPDAGPVWAATAQDSSPARAYQAPRSLALGVADTATLQAAALVVQSRPTRPYAPQESLSVLAGDNPTQAPAFTTQSRQGAAWSGRDALSACYLNTFFGSNWSPEVFISRPVAFYRAPLTRIFMPITDQRTIPIITAPNACDDPLAGVADCPTPAAGPVLIDSPLGGALSCPTPGKVG
jgi:hypothetical protein